VIGLGLPALCGEGGAHGDGSRSREPAGRCLGGHWEVVSMHGWCAVADREGGAYAALGIAVQFSGPTWLRWCACEGGVESVVVVVAVIAAAV
jgi:hypothetical protein